MPLHLLVRDYPETLAVLRRFGVDVARRGGSPVTEAVDGDVGPLIDAVIAATSWREAA